jgi:biopolymer transport protein ExbB
MEPTGSADSLFGLTFDIAALEQLLALGGPVVIILSCLSIVGLAIALLKVQQFRRAKLWRTAGVSASVRAFRAGDLAAANAGLATADSALARAVAAAVSGVSEKSPDVAREVTEITATAEIEALRGGLRPLEFIAAVSPLLGLFGTVLGMIAAFQALESAGDRVDPAVLAGGIWEALFTTAAGLAVAIPALALSNWFERSLDTLAHRMEHFTGLVLTATARADAPPAQQTAVAAE